MDHLCSTLRGSTHLLGSDKQLQEKANIVIMILEEDDNYCNHDILDDVDFCNYSLEHTDVKSNKKWHIKLRNTLVSAFMKNNDGDLPTDPNNKLAVLINSGSRRMRKRSRKNIKPITTKKVKKRVIKPDEETETEDDSEEEPKSNIDRLISYVQKNNKMPCGQLRIWFDLFMTKVVDVYDVDSRLSFNTIIRNYMSEVIDNRRVCEISLGESKLTNGPEVIDNHGSGGSNNNNNRNIDNSGNNGITFDITNPVDVASKVQYIGIFPPAEQSRQIISLFEELVVQKVSDVSNVINMLSNEYQRTKSKLLLNLLAMITVHDNFRFLSIIKRRYDTELYEEIRKMHARKKNM